MKKLGLNEIREKFLEFFASNDHLTVRSYPLIPQDDKSLLFIVAGMVPLKNYFSGLAKPPKTRMATVQKCIRTNDIDNVGHTARHASFFEMLGNFSFGDYFKKEAIKYAWDFSINVLGLPKEKVWASVYEEDDEAYELWQSEVGMPKERIVRLGEDNFWEIGTGTGPCGPCSELFFDRGEKFGCGSPDCKPGCECDRYVEYWNLVFTQFDKQVDGSMVPLEHPNIDTGMGLERIACIMQEVDSIFDVDTFRETIKAIEKISGKKYGDNPKDDVSMRIITDHIRAVTFIVSEGVTPDNEGRGYVLRMLFRRAVRHGKLLGINRNFMSMVADSVIDVFGDAYAELKERREYTKSIIDQEEERFYKTLDSGLKILDGYIDELKRESNNILDGELAFKLYDTYGFPLDLTSDILRDHGITVDVDVFNQAMNEQRERARASRSTEGAGWDLGELNDIPKEATEFLGYETFSSESTLKYLTKSSEGNALAVFDKTPFYVESGGQVGDIGSMIYKDSQFEILSVKKLPSGQIVHEIKDLSVGLSVGEKVLLKVNSLKRLDTMKNHTATHLLHKALRDVLGNGVAQAGSLVDENKLRFDFTNNDAMTRAQIEEVEMAVNSKIFEQIPVETEIMPIEDAKKLGAMALFGEKYSDIVRVLKISDYSIELCGGTHVSNTKDIGIFRIVSENAAAAGVRRIEAITGRAVYELMKSESEDLRKLREIMKAQSEQLVSKVEFMIEERRQLLSEIKVMKSKIAGAGVSELVDNSIKVKGVSIVKAVFDEMDQEALRTMADEIANRVEPTMAVLANKVDGKVTFVVKANKAAIDKGAHSGKVAKNLAAICGGGGGGKPEMAQAGGKDISKVEEALNQVSEMI